MPLTEAQSRAPALQLDLIEELRHTFGMTFAQFCAMHHLPHSGNLLEHGFDAHGRYCRKIQNGPTRMFRRGSGNTETSQRLSSALERLKKGATWVQVLGKPRGKVPAPRAS